MKIYLMLLQDVVVLYILKVNNGKRETLFRENS